MPVLYTAVGYASSDINHTVISFVYKAIGCACSVFILGYTNNIRHLGGLTVGKIDLSPLIRYRIVVYTSSVPTQRLGTLAVK